jgi:hypothetical protein
MMYLGFTYLFVWAGNARKNDEIRIHLPVRVGWQTGKMMKLGFTCPFLFAGKPRKNYEIRIHLPVPVCWQTKEK